LHPAIDVSNLSFGYDGTSVLEDVDLSVQPGEFAAIFGPNGGGKTTFLKLLMGFLTPRVGSLSLFGLSPKKARSLVGYTPQSIQYDKQFPISVLEVVLQGCLSKASRWGFFSSPVKQKARYALEKVGAGHLEKRAFGTLSGGQAQRVLLARAIVLEPKLLLLDEPTASIDGEAQLAIYALLKELQQSMTIVMVTHDLQAAVKQANRLFCIQKRATAFSPAQVCDHFTMGLYHPPIRGKSP